MRRKAITTPPSTSNDWKQLPSWALLGLTSMIQRCHPRWVALQQLHNRLDSKGISSLLLTLISRPFSFETKDHLPFFERTRPSLPVKKGTDQKGLIPLFGSLDFPFQ